MLFIESQSISHEKKKILFIYSLITDIRHLSLKSNTKTAHQSTTELTYIDRKTHLQQFRVSNAPELQIFEQWETMQTPDILNNRLTHRFPCNNNDDKTVQYDTTSFYIEIYIFIPH